MTGEPRPRRVLNTRRQVVPSVRQPARDTLWTPGYEDPWYSSAQYTVRFSSNEDWYPTPYTVYLNQQPQWLTTGSSTITLAYDLPWTWTGGTTTLYTTATNGYTRSGFSGFSNNTAAPLTPEERARRDQERLQRRLESEQRAAEHAVALVRSYELLDLLLNDNQRQELARQGCITVLAPSGNRYRLRKGAHAGNVDMWDPQSQRWTGRLCVHVSGRYPDGDNLAAQLLAITTDEAHFLRTANRQDGYMPAGFVLVRGHDRIDGAPQRAPGEVLEEARRVNPAEVQEFVQEVSREMANVLDTTRNLAALVA